MLKAPFKFEFLGCFCIRQGRRKIDRFRTYKTGVLLAFLAYYGKRPHPREELIEMLWTECDPALGRNSLSQSLSSLRRQLEPPGVASGEVLQADRYKIRLNPATYQTDVEDFEDTCRTFQSAEREAERDVAFSNLLKLYGGEFLPGFYEDWNLRERERLQLLFLKNLSARIGQLEKQGDLPTAIEYARRAAGIDPLDEEIHLHLMNLYVADDKPTQALRQYEKLSEILKQELDIIPSETAQSLAESLKIRKTESANRPSKPASGRSGKDKFSKLSSLTSGILTIFAVEPRTAGDESAELIELISRFQGEFVYDNPDVLLAVFKNASDAFDCGIRIQRTFDEKFLAGDPKLLPKIALTLGDIKKTERAAPDKQFRPLLKRVLPFLNSANPGQFLCSETVAGLLLNNLEPNVKLQELGSYRLSKEKKTERIYQADYAGRPLRKFPALKAGTGIENTLPLQLSRFFGREAETEIISEYLKPANKEVRLVTITGPGGTGKTRFSLEIARSLLNDYQNAVWFVPLASIKEPRYIPNTILEAMRLETPVSIDSLDYLISNLSRGKSLLILDNFEQFLSETSSASSSESKQIVITLLERVPDLHCLITSRRRLGLFGEKEFFLEPLPVPSEREPVERINLCESVRMFLDRSQSVRPSFQLTKNNADAVAELCRRLEGIPLALELAAAQIPVLTPLQILKKLSRRLDFLTDRRHQSESRHQQLRATVDWSFQMLSGEVQDFFAKLSIFRDGGDLTDVEAVCDAPLALDHLALLQDFSFLRIEENPFSGNLRFQILETLREYGEEKLSFAEGERLRERHVQNYLNLAETARPSLKGKDQARWLQRFEQDHQNFLGALDWCLANKKIETGLRLLCALRRFWEIRGYVSLGREKLNEFWNLPETKSIPSGIRIAALLNAGKLALTASDYPSARKFLEQCDQLSRHHEDILSQAEATAHLSRAMFYLGDYSQAATLCKKSKKLCRDINHDQGGAVSLNTLGMIAGEQDDFSGAIKYFKKSLKLYRGLGNQRGIANLLNNLGVIYRRQGEYRKSKAAFAESLEIRRELKDRRYIAGSLNNLSLLAENEQDYEKARQLQEESLTLRREIGDEYGEALSLEILGIITRQQGDTEEAQKLFEESLEIHRRLENKLGIAETLSSLGDLLSAKKSFADARRYLTESFELMAELNNKTGLAEVLKSCSRLALLKEQYDNSTKLFFAAETLQKNIGVLASPSEQKKNKSQISQLQTALRKKDFEQAKKQGVSMSPDQASALISKI